MRRSKDADRCVRHMGKNRRESEMRFDVGLIIAVLSLLVSVIALYYSRCGVSISAQVEEPIFVQTSTLPAIEMGGDPYAPLDTVGVRFFNYGGVPRYIKSVSAYRVWAFSNAVKPENDFAFFVADFYTCGPKLAVRGYRDVVAESFNVNNNKFEFGFHNEFYKLAAKRFVGFDSCTVCKVEYENKLRETGVAYFKNGKPIDPIEYESHFKKIPKDILYGVPMCSIKVSDVVDRLVNGLGGKVEVGGGSKD